MHPHRGKFLAGGNINLGDAVLSIINNLLLILGHVRFFSYISIPSLLSEIDATITKTVLSQTWFQPILGDH
jgi:hypothetical protein